MSWEKLKDIRYSVNIDEEGFPHFDGLQVRDDNLIRTLFENLRHFEAHNRKSPLITSCEGETCFWNAFDAPLVAQSVDHIDDHGSMWNFPGQLSFHVSHADLEVDTWQRLHARVGPERIAAVLSRKAQAEFLNRAPLTRLHPTPHRMARHQVHTESFWTRAYQKQEDGWELNAVTPVLTEESERFWKNFPLSGQVLVPGCGRGHEAAYLAQELNFLVTAVDFAPAAIEQAIALYPRARVQWKVEDVFSFLTHCSKEEWDAVCEHTFFCAMDPSMRQKYLQEVHRTLKPKGYLFGVFLLKTSEEGPPFGLTQWELHALTEKYFDIKEWRISKFSVTPRLSQELWVVLKKKNFS